MTRDDLPGHDPPAPDGKPSPDAESLDPATLCALNSALLRRAGDLLGLGADLTPAVVARFERYAAEIVVWNRRFNLTRLTRPDQIAVQHFLDALMCLRGVPGDHSGPLRCVDVGAGAGLPGLALKLVRPAWHVTLVDAVGKKAAFLRHVVDVLELEHVDVLHARAEDVGRDAAHREAYDLALARAVAPLAVVAEYLLPLVRVGGRAVAQKGAEAPAELERARGAVAVLGGAVADVLPYELPGVDQPRHLVVLSKTSPTPRAYPRRAGEPSRRPIS